MTLALLLSAATAPPTPAITSYIDIAVKVLGFAGGLIAAFKAIQEMRNGRQQRERDYRWKQTNAAKELIDELMDDKLAMDFTQMLDWDGEEYKDEKDQQFEITHDDFKKALRTENLVFTEKEKFVRAAFDNFLNYTEFMEQFIQNDLFQYADVIYPMEYYINTAKEMGLLPVLQAYMDEYRFSNSLAFFERVADNSR